MPQSHPILSRLHHVPQAPGVYQWKDAQGTVLYVGKSKNLQHRMRSYFGSPRSLTTKTRRLVAQIADFEIMVTQTELEALLLEMNLIKRQRPRYNILLKDDKSYPYIKVTLNEEWPRVLSTKHVRDDGARYFGPYASSASVRTTLTLLNRLFAFRPFYECKDAKFFRHRRLGRPCLYYDMKRCLGPCVPDLVSHADYRQTLESVCRFLDGKSDHLLRELRQRMHQAADALEFERAALLRDQIHALEHVQQKQQVFRMVDTDQDVIAFAREDDCAVMHVLFIRGGKLIGAEPFILQGTDDEDDSALLGSFLTQFYDRVPEVPPHVLLADSVEEPMIIERWLSQKRGHRVQIEVPRRGEKRRLIELATQNAYQKLAELRASWQPHDQHIDIALTELATLLGLPQPPTRIECYDVSNLHGHHSVASMVVFHHGRPAPRAYRHFRVTTVAGANDVASIAEVVRRRFTRARATSSSTSTAWRHLPDLILVDGGRGQLNGAYAVLSELGYGHIPIIGVAKGTARNRFDLIRLDSEAPIVLPRNTRLLHLVQRIDEEAHRFAITYHRKRHTRSTLHSLLDEVPGIGPKRKQALLTAFPSLDAMRHAPIDDLAAVPGMTQQAAETLKAYLSAEP